jgi:hypothetical protein
MTTGLIWLALESNTNTRIHVLYSRPMCILINMLNLDFRSMSDKNDKFESMTIAELKQYLMAREVPVPDARKVILVRNCYAAKMLGLPEKETPEVREKNMADTIKSKLVLDGGMIRLPNPEELTGWDQSSTSLPDITQSGVERYFDKSKCMRIRPTMFSCKLLFKFY